jgi:hypothetical protein
MKTYKADVHRKCDRRTLVSIPKQEDIRSILASDFDYIDSLDIIIDRLEKSITKSTHRYNRKHFKLLQTIPGAGPITALTILYETHTIDRFETAQRYSSYARVVGADNESGGSSYGHTSRDKIGNPYLKWALSEIGIRMVNQSSLIGEWYVKQVKEHGKGGSQARLRHKIALAVFYMLKYDTGFDEHKFLGIYKSRTVISAHNGTEKSGQNSNPSLTTEKPSGSLKVNNRKKNAKKNITVPGRVSLRITGKRKVLTKSKSIGR